MADVISNAIPRRNSRQNKVRPWMTAAQEDFVRWRTFVEADGWLTPDTYGKEFAWFTNIPAVYLFNRIDMNDWSFVVAYVGMSTNLLQRMTGHPVLAEVAESGLYVQRWFKPTPREKLRAVERQYIQKFNPPWNIIGKKRGLDHP